MGHEPPTRTIDEKVARSGVTLLRISPILGAYNRRPVRGRHVASPIDILRIVLWHCQVCSKGPKESVRDGTPTTWGGVAKPGDRTVGKRVIVVILLSSQFWPMLSMSRGVINCVKQFLSHPLSRIKWVDQWAVDRDPVLTSTSSTKIGKTAMIEFIRLVVVNRAQSTKNSPATTLRYHKEWQPWQTKILAPAP